MLFRSGGGGHGVGSQGSGGSGIGGSGSSGTGGAGTTNTGSGGGAGDSAGSGGSGIVIIRYKTSSGITATGGTITNIVTGIAKQRFVENFSGSVLDTDRWDQSNTNGTQVMADSIDGGLLMSTTSSGSSISYIDFADKKQFSNTGSVMIAVMKHGSTTGGESYTGLQSGTTQGNGQGAWSYVNDSWKGAVFNFYTVGASGDTWVQTGCVTSDTNWHIHKIELTSSAGSLQIDGNTTVTSTTNLPAVSLQPSVGINNTSAVNRTLNIRYMECYNT